MTEQTLQDRLRRAKLVEEYNDQMFDEAADCIDELQAEVARMRESLKEITQEYDPSDYGGIAEAMFTIAGDALQIDKD
jgi:HPt (histidine-containing phosphotransfer) domain-containing protein